MVYMVLVYFDRFFCTNLLFSVCDPVMGDNGKMYVPKELLSIYKNEILPLATILVPNLFEAQLLTDMTIENEEQMWTAIDLLHGKGIQTVFISSAEFSDKNQLVVFASSRRGLHTFFLLLINFSNCINFYYRIAYF